jgi:hypothetical protein
MIYSPKIQTDSELLSLIEERRKEIMKTYKESTEKLYLKIVYCNLN